MISQNRIVAISILVLVAMGLVVWTIMSRPSNEEIRANIVAVPSFPDTIINSEVIGVLSKRQTFGVIPVAPHPADPVRDNPFQ